MNPTLGRIAHYVTEKHTQPRAALITHVHSTACVDLVVFDRYGGIAAEQSIGFFRTAEAAKAAGAQRACYWPPRDED